MHPPQFPTTMLAIVTLLLLLTTPTTTLATTPKYKLTDDFSATDFFPAFDFFTSPDPTNGFVSYQSLASASSSSLIGYLSSPSSIYMGVDSTTHNPPSGRASVRIESKKTWNGGLMLASIRHMPHSECGIWPAFWLVSGTQEWPFGGEIDVLEGVNEGVSGIVSLHTGGGGCLVDGLADKHNGSTTGFTGNMTSANCDVDAVGQAKNKGCSITAPEGTADGRIVPSYGSRFNEQGGGVYAMEWSDEGISVWFFARSWGGWKKFLATITASDNSTLLPDNVLDTSTWPAPIARFAGKGCDFSKSFRDLKIVFDTTFCGEWAGGEWESSGCKAKTGVETCEAFVGGHPEKFEEAFWEVEYVRWYQGEEDGGNKKKTGRAFRA